MLHRALPTLCLLAPLSAQEPQVLELTIFEAARIAQGNNLDLRLAQVQTEITHFESLGSWGAFDWVFDASATYSDSTREGAGFLSGGAEVETEVSALDVSFTRPLETGGSFQVTFGSSTQETTSVLFNEPEQTSDELSVTYTQPLLRGAWNDYATSLQRESEILWRSQLEGEREARQGVVLAVAQAYWDLVSAIDQLGVAESAVELGQSRLNQNQRQLDAGVGTEIDVLQARAELATRGEALLQAQNDLAQRMDDLRKLLFAGKEEALWGLELKPTTPFPDASLAAEIPSWTAAVAPALERRSDLRQRRLGIDAAHLRHARSLSEREAGLDLNLSLGSGAVDERSSRAFEDTLGFDYPSYSATLSYNLPIGNRSADNAERAAAASVRSAQLEYDRTELEAVAQVRAAVRAVRYAGEQIRATEESLTLATRQLEAEEARMAEGFSTTFQVLEFQQSLIEAMSNHNRAQAGFAKALVALRDAQGLLGEELP